MTDTLPAAEYRRLPPVDLADALAEQCRRAGLPAPEREARLIEGRRWRFDCVWRDARLVAEVDGGTWLIGRHQRPAGFEADCEKLNAASLAGWRVLRLPGPWVRDGRALDWVERALDVRRTDHNDRRMT